MVNYEMCAGNAGAELDMTDCDAKTGLHLACSEGHYDVVVQLLRAGANVNLVNLQVNTCAVELATMVLRRFAKISQSQRRPLVPLEPSPGLKFENIFCF